MKHTQIHKISFAKIAAQQPHPGMEGLDLEGGLGTTGALAGGAGGVFGGLKAAPHLTQMAGDVNPLANKGGLMDSLQRGIHGAQSIVPPSAEGWMPDAVRHLGVTKSHGSKLLAALALLAPALGGAAGGALGGSAGSGIGRIAEGR